MNDDTLLTDSHLLL